ncbi:tryptophan halogenase [Duganella sp. CF402]|uniref:tryptophan halogenase family protein n=1 Tax=unclassified Duganella TaxID=2636909 RepID=UPI0008D4F49F|nr:MULTISPECIES: tryptophan halogenase family protein [unclassified Duganella]RZT05989.1 tryptophan halogenase [Duganella sp. BK701]SEM79999.1 tryptophan halogenase [Duganella sp. CF402]
MQNVRRVVIAGGGTAGWMAAAALSKTLGKVIDLTLVESDEIATVGVGEATIPTMITFHNLLELSEPEFMAATQATFKLGISFENWRDVNQDYIHSFGTTGTDHWSAGFQHFWRKGVAHGLASDYGDYCRELKASLLDRFAHLPDNGMNYAYHLDAGLYARYLRKFSEPLGCKRIEGKIVQVNTNPANGYISSLTMADGSQIEGDLFIDCSGFRGLLIGQTLGVEYEDWSQWLLCDSALAVQTASTSALPPLTRAIAHGSGWQWRIPLQHRVGNGLVYSSKHMDDETAHQTLMGNLAGEPLMNPRPIRFTPGQRVQTWRKNCVAIGLSSGFLEPIESTSIHMIQRSLIRLLQVFPANGPLCQSDIDEFNTQAATEVHHIRDFIIAHYKITNRRDTQFWRDCAALEVPPSLRHRIDLFRESGKVFKAAHELFAENSWIQVMLGQGILPERYHPIADRMGEQELAYFLNNIKSSVSTLANQLPSHAEYIQRYCRAQPL